MLFIVTIVILISYLSDPNIFARTNPVTPRSKAWVCGHLLARIAVSDPAGSMSVCLLRVLCVLTGRGVCDGPITGPENSYGM
jgi:hypothetical protein